ncbi:MAG TPA: oligosaccharide flippase family protein, partial [Bacteroidales bacterium]|nr:oligosaccharide flippase family protein [Bacteroidales bacterium]
MQRKFITNLALLIFLNLLVKPFWIFGIDRSVQNAVGAGEYGSYFALLNFTFIFNILLDLGITNFNNRNIARHQQLLHKHFSGIVSLRIVLALLYLGVTMSLGVLAGYGPEQLGMMAILAANQFLAAFILYIRSNISGLLLFRTDSLISVLDRSLMILFCGLLLWTDLGGGEFSIMWLVWSQTLAYGLTALVALAAVVRRSGFSKLRFGKAFSLMILKKSFPFALLILLMTLHNRLDAVLLERLLPAGAGAEQAGIYAQGFRLLDAVNQFAYLFAVLLLPLFSRMLGHHEPVTGLVKLAFILLFTGTFILSVFSSVYSLPLMDLLYKEHEEAAAGVFRILIWASVPMAVGYVFGTLLTANGNLYALSIIAAAGMAVSVLLNLLLIPGMQSLGPAIAALATQGITVLAQVVLSL